MVIMSKMLSDLLQADEPLFSIALQQLENASGKHSADVKLAAEIIRKVHQKTRELGLDSSDTTGRELYFALLGMVERHDEFLVRKLGGNDPTDVQEMLPLIKSAVEGLDVPMEVTVLKCSVAKRMLKACPPKKVMKHLGYRSVDSMLKREPIMEIYSALRFAETPEWLDGFIQKYRALKVSDFETRRIEILQLDASKWGGITEAFVHKKRHNVTHLKELGVIVMLPMPMTHMKGITIAVLPLLLHYINEIRLYSAYFKMQQVRANFGDIIVNTLIADPDAHAVIAGQNIHWRVIQRYFGKLENEDHPEIFEPHVQPEDLHWRKAEEVLYRMEPALHFWHDMDYVAAMQPDGRPISFNLMDVALSYINELDYEHRAIFHVRESLWNQIFMQYLGHKTLEVQILRQLDNEMIEPEALGLSLRGRA